MQNNQDNPNNPGNPGLFWLASYPKSGNTWFRIVLANLFNTSNTPIDLNQINTGEIASSRPWIDTELGFDSADLSPDEIDQIRPKVYQWHSQHLKKSEYHKIHDAYSYLNQDSLSSPMIPSESCAGAIYFIRNPLDVAISFANHSHCSIDQAIENMGNTEFAFCRGKYRQYDQLRQWLFSWSLHVQSWESAKNINLLMIRYEDMKQKTLETFR